MSTLKDQYELIKSSRNVLFSYCSQLSAEHFNMNLESFGGRSVCYLFVHIADTYLSWLASFGMKLPVQYFETLPIYTVEEVKAIYDKVDNTVAEFLNLYQNRELETVSGDINGKPSFQSTPFILFTHVITHEFHHKGQILSMTRQLGYIPVDTDVIRTG